MRWRNSIGHWGLISKLFHWLMAISILFMAGLGLTMINVRLSPMKLEMFIVHKSLGILLLAMAIMRIAWRFANPTPALPESMSRREILFARFTHVWIYVLLIGIPLSGWVINSAADFPLRWFGLFEIPSIAAPSIEVEEFAKKTHMVLLIALGVTIGGHIFAALRHHIVLGDNILRRMWGQ